MLRKEKLREILTDTFGIPSKDIDTSGCSFIKCPDFIPCYDCPYYLFWKKQYEGKAGDANV